MVKEKTWTKDPAYEKEIWISLDDLIDGIRQHYSPSWVSDEKLILRSDMTKIIKNCRKMEA